MTQPDPPRPPDEFPEAGAEGGPRARRMAERILRTAVDAGVTAEGLAMLASAHRAAMRFREGGEEGIAGLPSEKHPAYLHPGRVVLILLEDLEEPDARVLAAGAMAEGRDLDVGVRPPVAARIFRAEDEAYEWWTSLPRPDWGRSPRPLSVLSDQALLERLVGEPAPVQRIALADALDHLRHAHLWESPGARARAATLAIDVFGPLAPRVHPAFERRFGWWIRRVAPSLADE